MRWKVGPWDGLRCDWLTGQGLLPCVSWAAVEGVGLQGALADLESKGLILSWSSTADTSSTWRCPGLLCDQVQDSSRHLSVGSCCSSSSPSLGSECSTEVGDLSDP